VVGGGGLIQLPALMIFLPPALAAQIPAVFGTNKFASICGTSVAATQYIRRVDLRWSIVLPAAGAAFVLSGIGARTVTLLDPAVLKPLILLLLVLVALYTWKRKSFGQSSRLRAAPKWEVPIGILVGGAIGFYDGFFGPGTGSFLIFMFVMVFGFDFLHASAGAKIVNFSTNLSAVLYFAFTGNIYYQYAIPMAFCNVLGSTLGARMAILKGNQFIRKLFLIVLAALMIRLAWELFFSP
jgi:uncharacterized protein